MEKILKNTIKKAIIITLIFLVYGILVKSPAIYIGMVSGSIISILNFYLLIKDTSRYVLMASKVERLAFFGYLKRYVISGILLLIMIKIGIDYFFGAVLGVLLIKFIILSSQFYNIVKDTLKKIIK